MSNKEDEDVQLHKASGALISDFQRLLGIILWKPSGRVHRLVRRRDLDKAINLIDPFQEEPQLLDPHLKNIVPTLIEAFLLQLQNAVTPAPPKACTIASAISKLLYILCKIRGEKVIVGFFNHDPQNLEPILRAYEAIDEGHGEASTWQERYILMLWLWHLMLVPFDLQTLSDDRAAVTATSHALPAALVIPEGLPAIARRVVPLCAIALASATKERDAAAKVLARLAIRDDMRVQGLLPNTISWAVQELRSESLEPSMLHQKLGLLSFINSLTSSASVEALRSSLDRIYIVCQALLSGQLNAGLSANAVARKILIKISRNIVLLCLQSPGSTGSLDPSDVLSEVVDSLLTIIGDSDTPVRYAASKVLSAITLKLDPEMASEVIEAILASLREDLIPDSNGQQSTDAVSALRWHGLTLALAQLLYRRAPSTDQLPAMLDALVLSLEFSQRSAAGVAIGTNVRDAACFGLWALSRRYTTAELLAVDLREQQSMSADSSKQLGTVPMWLATRLLAAACLDPSGNIRRGASAALQELIGRNPDTVSQGISLVQIVDYQAVGLRRRAMVNVGVQAAGLDEAYFKVLYHALQGDRALFAVDDHSRGFAAEAFGLLCAQRGISLELASMRHLAQSATRLGLSMSVQDRHGVYLALAEVLSHVLRRSKARSGRVGSAEEITSLSRISGGNASLLQEIGPLLDLPEKDFASATRSPHLTAVAVCRLIAALTSALLVDPMAWSVADLQPLLQHVRRLFALSLSRIEPDLLDLVPQCATNILKLSQDRRSLVDEWLLASAVQGQGYTRNTSHIIALGAAYAIAREHDSPLGQEALNSIAMRCGSRVDVDARVMAVRALGLAMEGIDQGSTHEIDVSNLKIAVDAIHTAMCDYTVNERGDVGSLVRLEALSTLTNLSRTGWRWMKNDSITHEIMPDIARLSLEKLDKVRGVAQACLLQSGWDCPSTVQVSSHAWFAYWLDVLRDSGRNYLREAIVEGYCSSAGNAAENVLREARAALLAFLGGLSRSAHGDETFDLLAFADLVKSALKSSVDNDRVLLSIMETLAFLLDMRSFADLIDTTFNWRSLLIIVQKSHYQSKSVPKILTALDIYRGLAEVPQIRADVIKKLKDMRRNPMAAVKRATEETLYVVEGGWRNEAT